MEEKKQMSKGTRVLLIIACVIVGIAVLFAGTVLIMSRIGHNALTGGDGVEVSDKADILDNGIVSYEGKQYQFNDQVTSVLLMGIDKSRKAEFDGVYGDANQSDVNVLVILDPVKERMTLLAISRDTMCEIDILDEEGNYLGPTTAQLAIAHGYGDGGERSCELTADAVSGILHGISIPAYGSIYMDGICKLVDLVGGVQVTPNESFRGFTAGEPVTLTGKLTETFIRYREHTTEGNNERMRNQNQVILALVHKCLDEVREDPACVPALYAGLRDSVTTNVTTSMMVYLAKAAAGMSFDGTVHSVPGESVLGENNYAEFYVDEDALFEMILDLYYLPVE